MLLNEHLENLSCLSVDDWYQSLSQIWRDISYIRTNLIWKTIMIEKNNPILMMQAFRKIKFLMDYHPFKVRANCKFKKPMVSIFWLRKTTKNLRHANSSWNGLLKQFWLECWTWEIFIWLMHIFPEWSFSRKADII